LQTQDPPQLQKNSPLPFRLTRLTRLPQEHFVGSAGSRLQAQPSMQEHSRASSLSILITWCQRSGLPQAQFPGTMLNEVQSQLLPQSQA